MGKAEVNAFKKRRASRYDNVIEKIKYYDDEAQIYKNKECMELMAGVKAIIKEYSNSTTVKVEDGTAVQKYFDVSNIAKNDFADRIVEKVREVAEINLDNVLKEQKDDLLKRYFDDNIEYIETKEADKYRRALSSIMHLAMLKEIRENERIMQELRKDIISCIDYNDKIDKEIVKSQVEKMICEV